MNSILVTGATGFVGKNLKNYLEERQVRAISLDLRADYSIAMEINALVHLAGKAHDLKNVSNPDEYYQVNYRLTRKLYDAFLESGAKKIIFISSVKAAADTVIGKLTEEFVPEPQTHYGNSKLLAEQYIQSQSLPAGKSYYILRPCMIHGPGNKGNLNLLNQFVSKGLPYPLSAFENKRSFLSIENLCFVIKEILERDDIPSGVYHVADDEALSTSEVVKLLAEAQGKRPRLWNISTHVVKWLAMVGDLVRLPLNSERLQKLTESYVVSNEKIKTALGKELPVGAREGILRTAKSFNE